MLADDNAVRSVLIDSGALAVARRARVHVAMSTISPALVDELLELHERAKIAYVAAPVFGIPAVAAAAQLTILAAGSSEALTAAQPLFDVLGKKTWHLGDDPRHANIAKIAGNMMIALAIEAMGEAAALTRLYGLEPGAFFEIVTNTMFACTSYQRYSQRISRDIFEPGFKLTLGLKDVELALDAARTRHETLPGAEVVRESMRDAVAQGFGSKDWSALTRATHNARWEEREP
jgi:3-hydroxyisobutyrate dehydrogenase-like beta-hydroxyacid dehydrogenase